MRYEGRILILRTFSIYRGFWDGTVPKRSMQNIPRTFTERSGMFPKRSRNVLYKTFHGTLCIERSPNVPGMFRNVPRMFRECSIDRTFYCSIFGKRLERSWMFQKALYRTFAVCSIEHKPNVPGTFLERSIVYWVVLTVTSSIRIMTT